MPSISEMSAGSFGLRASNSSTTRGRPPVMSLVPVIRRACGVELPPRGVESGGPPPRRLRVPGLLAEGYQRAQYVSVARMTMCGLFEYATPLIPPAGVMQGDAVDEHVTRI